MWRRRLRVGVRGARAGNARGRRAAARPAAAGAQAAARRLGRGGMRYWGLVTGRCGAYVAARVADVRAVKLQWAELAAASLSAQGSHRPRQP